MGLSFTDVCAGALDRLSSSELLRLEQYMQRLEAGEPVQYVIGSAEFCCRRFGVSPAVLIPRPETEELCDWVNESVDVSSSPRILDIGTGSGCIAITLALNIPQSRVSAWDISSSALDVACANAEQLGAHVSFSEVDVLERSEAVVSGAISDASQWDVIVSNPPYICEKEKADMDAHVLKNEPSSALFVPDDDPLLFYRNIAEYAVRSLTPGGLLFFEINPLYVSPLCELLHRVGFCSVEVREDAFSKSRMVRCRA
jgi:release factor glutamine methyltransferase